MTQIWPRGVDPSAIFLWEFVSCVPAMLTQTNPQKSVAFITVVSLGSKMNCPNTAN